MKAFAVFVLSLFTLFPPRGVVQGFVSTSMHDVESRLKAESLWEQAMVAKGGRERLYAIRNFVVSSKSRFRLSPRPDVATGISEDDLYVLPDKWWNFEDYRPGKMGYHLNVLDFKHGVMWGTLGERLLGPSPNPDVDKDIYDYFKYRFRQAQFLYLLETRWAKPTFIGARTESIGLKKYDVVETVIAEREMKRAVRDRSTGRLKVEVIDDQREVRADFYLDRKTHLPVRITIDGSAARGSGRGEMDYVCRLGDYVEINGLQMPQKVNCLDADNQTSYQFNVDYNKSIFEHPPTSDMKPDAWRVTGK